MAKSIKKSSSPSRFNNEVSDGEKLEISPELPEKAVERKGEIVEGERHLTKEEIKELVGRIKETDFQEDLRTPAETKLADGEYSGEQEITKLLNTAKKRGVFRAVLRAREMSYYVLSRFYNVMAENGRYKSFLK